MRQEIIRLEIERYLAQLQDRDILILTLTNKIRELEKELEQLKCNTSE